MPLSSVETEIIQAENDIKSLQTKLNDIASNHQEQEVHIFQTIRNGGQNKTKSKIFKPNQHRNKT